MLRTRSARRRGTCSAPGEPRRTYSSMSSRSNGAPDSVSPRVSVIVAAYHSDAVIQDCLQALQSQTFTDFETIVVNSSPADGTEEIVRDRFAQVLFIEHSTRLLPHAARNLGVRVASGRILAFTDADCRPAQDRVEQCVRAQQAGHALG